MTGSRHAYVTPQDLRIGLYVDLELGWMAHPFPKGTFKISTLRQIQTLQGLGLTRVRYIPSLSDPPVRSAAPSTAPEVAPVMAGASEPALGDSSDPAAVRGHAAAAPANEAREQRAALLAAQRVSLESCDRQFARAMDQYRKTIACVAQEPLAAAALCRNLIGDLLADMLAHGECSIRLLSESTGDRAWMHPVNVTVLTLLLGKALGLAPEALGELGQAALLHDVGKIELPQHLRQADGGLTPQQYSVYQSHAPKGAALGARMQLSPEAQHTIAQHHELNDGSGFPGQALGPQIGQGAQLLALVNRYDNLCNPGRPAAALTPHEALSMIFAQMKHQHDTRVLAAFIRMLGVYPPGSVVQLTDGRHALVVSVNSARPLKPRVLVHEPVVAKEEALLLDLEQAPGLGVRRSLRPDLLPRAAADYLTPRMRLCYFFDRASDPLRGEVRASAAGPFPRSALQCEARRGQ